MKFKVELLAVVILFAVKIFSQEVPAGKPITTIDLASDTGARLVNGTWRYSDVKIVETDFTTAGADGQPGAEPAKTYDYSPHAGASEFDDSKWPAILPSELSRRRGNGRISFNWYRINITVPEMIDGFSTRGKTLVFQTELDDYAEIWVDGELSRFLGQSGGSVVRGWNAPNRLVVGRNIKPGQKIQLAVFGMNGPISDPPTNYIWIRQARLELYNGDVAPRAVIPSEVNVRVVKYDDAIERIVGRNPKAHKIAEGFEFTEGPVWTKNGLLFSDPNSNTIYQYTRDGKLNVFRNQSGYSGPDVAEYHQPGSNGLTLDPEGNLVINQHGNRRVVRVGKDGLETVLADKFEGKKLNSPNDLVFRSDGTLFFTDPPFGFPKVFEDHRKELSFSGVYSVYRGKLQLLTKEFTGPNGIALSPDEKYLYVGNWDEKRKTVYRYPVNPDGTVKDGELFFDFTEFTGDSAIDGIKVDTQGNVYVSAPGGLQILSADGKHLGTIVLPRHVHNMAWGDDDGMTLYLCAQSALYRMRLRIPGLRPLKG